MAALVLVGCGAGDEETGAAAPPKAKTDPKEETKPEKKREVAEIFKNAGPLECASHSDEVAVTLDADPDSLNAGVEMALKRGFFADAGLEVFVGGPKNPARAVHYVTAGVSDIGIAQEPQVVLSSEEGGAPVVAIGGLIHQSNATMIWLPGSRIRDVADLKGKTVGIPGAPFQEAFLGQVLEQAGLRLDDVTVERTNYKSGDALLEGRVDAVFGGAWNGLGAELEARGAEPVVTRARALGLPPYEELVVIAAARCAAKHPGVMRTFMRAIARGTEAARNHPVEAANFAAQSYRLDPRFRMGYLRAQFKASLPLLSTDAHMNLAKAAGLVAWMHKQGLIKRKPLVKKLFTNEYLAP